LATEDDEDFLEQAREWVQQGLTYTDKDLRDDLGADYGTVEDIRQWIADGVIFTEIELRDLMRGGEAGNASVQLQVFDSVRSWLGTARGWMIAGWLIPALLLLAIGVLGGRRWNDRLIWAAAALGIAAIITYIAFGPLFSAMAQPRIDDAVMQAVGQMEGFPSLMADKGLTIAQNVIDSFVGGIKSQALGLLAASVVLIALGVFWHIRGARDRD
jgi:hypothetical protein